MKDSKYGRFDDMVQEALKQDRRAVRRAYLSGTILAIIWFILLYIYLTN